MAEIVTMSDIDYGVYFKTIGERLEASWRAINYDLNAFPELAAAAAAEIDIPDIYALQRQQFATFDQQHRFSALDLHVFKSNYLRIEVLNWLGGGTSIHQHGFCGAFKLINGRSLHVAHEFQRQSTVGHDFMFGEMAVRSMEVMRAGDVRMIKPGEDFIHANFHLGRPTTTVVVRSIVVGVSAVQYTYMPPHVAYNPFKGLGFEAGRDALLEFLGQIDHDGIFENTVCGLLSKATVQESFDLMLHHRIMSGGAARFEIYLDVIKNRHAVQAQALQASLWEERRRRLGGTMRRRVKTRAQRFLLAVMINLTDLQLVRQMLAAEYPQSEPAVLMASLLHEIAEAGHLPKFAAADIPSLAQVLDGKAPAERDASYQDLLAAELLRPFARNLVTEAVRPAILSAA